jgi:hypothetical protein
LDTLLAAVLLDNQGAFTIVLVQMLSISIISIGLLAAVYRRYERGTLDFVAWVTAENRNVAMFMAIIFLAPIILMLIK